MPADNAATVAPGEDVDFPSQGPSVGTTITAVDADNSRTRHRHVGKPTALTITPLAGGNKPGAATLLIERIGLPARPLAASAHH